MTAEQISYFIFALVFFCIGLLILAYALILAILILKDWIKKHSDPKNFLGKGGRKK